MKHDLHMALLFIVEAAFGLRRHGGFLLGDKSTLTSTLPPAKLEE